MAWRFALPKQIKTACILLAPSKKPIFIKQTAVVRKPVLAFGFCQIVPNLENTPNMLQLLYHHSHSTTIRPRKKKIHQNCSTIPKVASLDNINKEKRVENSKRASTTSKCCELFVHSCLLCLFGSHIRLCTRVEEYISTPVVKVKTISDILTTWISY